MTLATLAGVDAALIHNASGPVPANGLDVWEAVRGAGETPPVPSPRSSIIHEADEKQNIYAIRDGDWKLIWGNIGGQDWVPDINYDSPCTKLLPPANSSTARTAAVAVTADGDIHYFGAEEAVQSDHPLITCTADLPCLFNVIDDPTEHADPLATAKANPDVVKRLQGALADYQSSMYTGGMDKAKTSEEDYCAFVKREKWLRPYDDDPSPPPSPPRSEA